MLHTGLCTAAIKVTGTYPRLTICRHSLTICKHSLTTCTQQYCCARTGHHVIIVTSGAVGVGAQRLRLTQKPTELSKKQALAAIGQVHLMKFYEDFLGALGMVRIIFMFCQWTQAVMSD